MQERDKLRKHRILDRMVRDAADFYLVRDPSEKDYAADLDNIISMSISPRTTACVYTLVRWLLVYKILGMGALSWLVESSDDVCNSIQRMYDAVQTSCLAEKPAAKVPSLFAIDTYLTERAEEWVKPGK